MSGESKLGWAGVALAIFGLPSTLLLFYQEHIVIGILSAVIVVGVIGVVWGMYWLLNRPTFTMLDINKTLKFEDQQAEKVSYTDTRRAKANHKGLTELWFKDIGPEGAIENVLIDGEAADLEEADVDDHKKRVCKRYPGALQWHEEVEASVSLVAKNLFPDQEREYFGHKVIDKTKKAQVRLEFHPAKRPNHVSVRLGSGGDRGEPMKNPKLTRLQQGRVWIWEVKKPKLGQHYRIEWEW